VDVPGAKRQALVACLALRSGRVVSTDTLVEALWGSDLPAAPRNAVQHHVTRLRRALGPDTIRLAADGYALESGVVDAIEFEELLTATRTALRAGDAREAADTITDALALWRGPALLGLPQSPWATAEAGRLDSLRLDALEERFEAALALGDHGEVAAGIRAALEESPFRERLWGQLMLALYRSGRQADALEVFQEARQVLLAQLALEPGPELRRLQEAILAHDPAIAPVPVAPQRRGNLPASSTSFIGGEAELAQVVELVREHRLVTLTGPPGVGKTRLALEAARALESELRGGAWHIGLANAISAADVGRSLPSPSTCAAPTRSRAPPRVFVKPPRSSSSTRASTSWRRARASSRHSSLSAPMSGCSPRAARYSMWWERSESSSTRSDCLTALRAKVSRLQQWSSSPRVRARRARASS
jgi:DNA-binding SARP family transcriptional activator